MKGILKTFTISVRSLVEEMLASGDIVSSMSGSIKANERALRGTRLHQKLQKAEDMGYEYLCASTKEEFMTNQPRQTIE